MYTIKGRWRRCPVSKIVSAFFASSKRYYFAKEGRRVSIKRQYLSDPIANGEDVQTCPSREEEENATSARQKHTGGGCSFNHESFIRHSNTQAPSGVKQCTRTVPSSLPLTTLSSLKPTQVMGPVWPVSVLSCFPVLGSQILIVLSSAPLTNLRESAASDQMPSTWPKKRWTQRPECTCQRRIVPSREPVSMYEGGDGREGSSGKKQGSSG
jgi:hypothetical protein